VGLDFNNSNAHWSCYGFNRFRARLANEIGIDLDNMAGFGGSELPWNQVKDDIKPLLNHSDCDGYLSVAEMKLVYPRLIELVSKWSDNYDKEHALILAKDMEICVKKNVPLEFQ